MGTGRRGLWESPLISGKWDCSKDKNTPLVHIYAKTAQLGDSLYPTSMPISAKGSEFYNCPIKLLRINLLFSLIDLAHSH